MAITTLDGLIAAARQQLPYLKTGTKTTVATIPFTIFDNTGVPQGTLAVGNTTTGIVPTDAIAGYPAITPFAGGAKGYLAGVEFGSSVACRLSIFDTLFSAGAFAFNASVALSSQPDYSSRLPGGIAANNTEIWLEAVTAFTGNQSIAITYTNQDGVTGRTTGTVALGNAPILGRMTMIPLAAGDTGVLKIESITSTVSTAGTFNVHVLRRLWQGRVRVANDGDAHDFAKTGMPEVFDTSALRVVVQTDASSSGVIEIQMTVASG